MNKFKEGDVVRAKMGGPKMTIEIYTGGIEEGIVNVVWFDLDIVHRDCFSINALELVIDE